MLVVQFLSELHYRNGIYFGFFLFFFGCLISVLYLYSDL